MNDPVNSIEPNAHLPMVPGWAWFLMELSRDLSLFQISDDEALVYGAFGDDSRSADQIFAKSGLPPATVSSRLLALELAVMSVPNRAAGSSSRTDLSPLSYQSNAFKFIPSALRLISKRSVSL